MGFIKIRRSISNTEKCGKIYRMFENHTSKNIVNIRYKELLKLKMTNEFLKRQKI